MSSPAIRKTSRASRSSGRPARCSIGRSTRPGIDRDDVYVTNAVKHFKWERGEKGKRRIHKKPNAMEIRACHPWLESEIQVVKPRVIVVLGATAAQSLLGKQFRVTSGPRKTDHVAARGRGFRDGASECGAARTGRGESPQGGAGVPC